MREMTAKGAMTDVQKRALAWLPEDGSWRERPGQMSAGLEQLWLRRPDLIEKEFGKFGNIRGGSLRWRLTAKGVQMTQASRRSTINTVLGR